MDVTQPARGRRRGGPVSLAVGPSGRPRWPALDASRLALERGRYRGRQRTSAAGAVVGRRGRRLSGVPRRLRSCSASRRRATRSPCRSWPTCRGGTPSSAATPARTSSSRCNARCVDGREINGAVRARRQPADSTRRQRPDALHQAARTQRDGPADARKPPQDAALGRRRAADGRQLRAGPEPPLPRALPRLASDDVVVYRQNDRAVLPRRRTAHDRRRGTPAARAKFNPGVRVEGEEFFVHLGNGGVGRGYVQADGTNSRRSSPNIHDVRLRHPAPTRQLDRWAIPQLR